MQLVLMAKDIIEEPLANKSDEMYQYMLKYCEHHFPELVAILTLEVEVPKEAVLSPPVARIGTPFHYLKPEQRELLLLKAYLADDINPSTITAIQQYDQTHPVFRDLETLECTAIKAYIEGELTDGQISAALILAATRFETRGRVEIFHINTPEGQIALKESCLPFPNKRADFMDCVRRIPLSDDKEAMQEQFLDLVLNATIPLSPIEKVFVRVKYLGDETWEKISRTLREFSGESSYILLMPTALDEVNDSAYFDNTTWHKGPFGYTRKLEEFIDARRRPISCPISGAHYENVHDFSSTTAFEMYLHDTIHLNFSCHINAFFKEEIMNLATFLNEIRKSEKTDARSKQVLLAVCAEITDNPEALFPPNLERETDKMDEFYDELRAFLGAQGISHLFDCWQESRKDEPDRRSFASLYRAFDAPTTVKPVAFPIYVVSNERGFEETQAFLKTQPLVENGCHIGCSALHNFDIIAQRKSAHAILFDANVETTIFLIETLKILQKSESRVDFVLETESWFASRYYERSISDELTREGSFLNTDEAFNHVRQLAISGNICPITQNIVNVATFQNIALSLRASGIPIDTLYLSNVCNYMKRTQKEFCESTSALLDEKTILIHCPAKLEVDTERDEAFVQRSLHQVACLGKDLRDLPDDLFFIRAPPFNPKLRSLTKRFL